MKFLAIVTLSIQTLAAKNTATLKFSNIKPTSDSILCRSTECNPVLGQGRDDLFSPTLIQKCLMSVWNYCSYTATVHITGELNEFCVGVRGNVIARVTDISRPLGRLAEDPEFEGTVKIQWSRTNPCNQEVCRFYVFTSNIYNKCPKGVINDKETYNDGEEIYAIPIDALYPDRSEVIIPLDSLVSEYILYGNTAALHIDSVDNAKCGRKLQKIMFSGVSWSGILKGFGAPKCPIDVCSEIISATGSPPLVYDTF